MACFSIMKCCSGGFREQHKLGAIVSPVEEQHQVHVQTQAKIPWVFSRKFHQSYQLGHVLGKGTFSVVHEGTSTSPPHDSFAIKVVHRKGLTRKQLVDFKDEVQILSNLKHPHIIGLCELYKEPGFFYVVMEKVSGGELFDRLCEIKTYNEADARDAMRVILEAVAYCHAHQVAHRDLKPENLLVQDINDVKSIKLADFGFAKIVERPNSLTTLCGSPMYTAPEIINYKPYDERVDNWALGVILFAILGGYPPFYQPTTRETFQQIRQCSYSFHPDYWSGVSPDAKKLIAAFLTVDMNQRISADQALDHTWMTGRGDQLSQRSLTGNLEQFKLFNKERKANQPVRSVSMYWLVSRR